VVATEVSGTEDEVTLRLPIPPLLEPVILGEPAKKVRSRQTPDGTSRASFTVAVEGDLADVAFDPLPQESNGDDVEAAQAGRNRRRARLDEGKAARAVPYNGPPAWTLDAFEELMARLRPRYQVQANAIVRAAQAGGFVSRAEVFDIGQYPNSRRLNGFTRPTERIFGQLVGEGLLYAGAQRPLTTHYEGGVRAVRFEVPAIFAKFVHAARHA
jgi:hypothetical protein